MAPADPTTRIFISAQVSTRNKVMLDPFWCGCLHAVQRERRQYPPEDGSHNLQEGSQQHLADGADTSLYVTHLEIIYRFGPHALQTWGGVSRKMLRKKQPTGKACTRNSLSVWNVLAGRGGLQLLALFQSSFFKKHWFESS